MIKLLIKKLIRYIFISSRNNFLIFKFDGKKINILKEKSYETRGLNVIKILEKIVEKNPNFFINKKGLITYDDRPFPWYFYKFFALSFCTTINTKKPVSVLPFPDPYFLGWVETGLKSSDDFIKNAILNSKKPDINKIFWAGANTNKTREKLINLSLKNQNIFETIMISWNRDNPKKLSVKNFKSLEEHIDYKYLIDCPGVGYSARLKWLLSTGRPVFIVERNIVEYWHKKLIPMIHYIPVKNDLSDLIEKYFFIEANTDIYNKISEEAKNFSQNNLFVEQQINKILLELK